MIIATEREGHIAYTTAYTGEWHKLLYFTGSFNKINCIIIVLFNAGGNGKNIGVENNILREVAYFVYQYVISPFANFHFAFFGIGLANFVESHYNYRSAIAFANESLLNKFFFSFFHGDGVHNAFALHAF